MSLSERWSSITKSMGIQRLIICLLLATASLWMGIDLLANCTTPPNPLSGGHDAHSAPSPLTWEDRVLLVNGTRYLVSSTPEAGLFFDNRDGYLVTVIEQPTDHVISVESIADTIARYEAIDDVWQAAFLSGIIFVTGHTANLDVDTKVRGYLRGLGSGWIDVLPAKSTPYDIQPGPYVVIEGRLHKTYKLVDDMHGTFMTAVRPPKSDTFEPLRVRSSIDDFQAVALPSRIRSRSCSNKPFGGFRIAIKDVLYLKGIKTSLQCRALYDTYGPNTETAECIAELQDGGAHILGTLKMNPIGHWVEPVEYVDYQAPWNPRADGYQSSGGSSTGPAAALAAYDWLDFTIGTDTWGSVMRPALWCGLFGIRPTTGSVSLQGMRRSILFMDTPGVYGRELKSLTSFVDSWLNHDRLQSRPKPFTSIVWATDIWDSVDQNQRDMAQEFFDFLQSKTGLSGSQISFAEEWSKTPPKEASGQTLDEYMVKAVRNLSYQPRQTMKQFRQDYRHIFGVQPYLSPPVQQSFENTSDLTENDFDDAMEHMRVYKSWFHARIWKSQTSHPLIILPIENMAPRYRDEFPNFRRPPPGVNSLFLSPVLGAPELLVPIDEIPYQSKVTGQEEKLPFVVGLMSLPGTDLLLMEEVYRILAKSTKYKTKVYTGKNMFTKSDS